MDSDQIEARVAQALDVELFEVEERLALDAWRINAPSGDKRRQPLGAKS